MGRFDATLRAFFVLLIMLSLSFSFSPCASSQSIEITDDLGQTVRLKQPAGRIIPLYGAFAEMLFALELDGEVIGRTQADEFPPQIVSRPSVGTHMRPNVEMILGLQPDLVVQSASRHADMPELERLRDAGVPVAVFAPRTFEEIFSVMTRLGKLTGREERAARAVAELRSRLAVVGAKLAGIKERHRVFFEVRAEPLTAAGRGGVVQEILAAAGAENICESDKAMASFSLEALLVADPHAYIVQDGPMNRHPLPPDKRSHFDRLSAVREGRVFQVDEFVYSRPGPRCVNAVEELAAWLYPERFQN